MKNTAKLLHLKCHQNYIGIFLTSTAYTRLLKINENNIDKKFIYLSLKKSGCLGHKYYITLFKKINNSILFFNKQIDIYIEQKNIFLIDGIIIDYEVQPFHNKFKYYNKNIQHVCGCGESFNIKNIQEK
ncbi:iron-sulfur cluster assembly accessory protein [Enterobacteriaceae endosymbiont of Macroplea appendiculata]|uniref:iron-sulfur cluster assembly accessory protein n=1 Tax=Enterobacteriaceae endosymbiont of Macroplea appendiculata TaxID=2675790 RepID=UPI0014493F8C|nr:iron-sulfur cluster assembly accessory protein [Enterobacteriaceae endosymbiont of Macroplea appendiculata]QJC30954.1 iron-sulfur cluster assembly accessory protein [Enterobacteriaceae endosymbiont of Macroplea appendiculata]